MDKTERLLDALNDPEKYSLEEIEEIMQDPEVKEILDVLDKTKSSLQPIPAPDIEDEWFNFKNKNRNEHKIKGSSYPTFFSGKVAASFIVALLSITAVAAIVGISVSSLSHKENISSDKEVTEAREVIVNQQDNFQSSEALPTESFETVIFDNEPLNVIMNHIGDFYGYKIEFKNDNAKSLRLYFRWNQVSTIQEIVESLNNFNQIHIFIEGETIKID